MIAGFVPRFQWQPNPDGVVRTIEDACEIAQRWGVVIPDYVSFAIAPPGYLDENTTARTTIFREFEGTIIDWSWFFHKLTGKIPFLIQSDIMASDEAIVAVIGHEMFELDMLRTLFGRGAPIEKWEAETSPNNFGNCHYQTWDYADHLVSRMRGVEE